MNRSQFMQQASLISACMMMNDFSFAAANESFPVVRVPPAKRKFTSKAIEDAILRFKKNVKQPELAWLFENCFPNTLDTTVEFEMLNNRPDTYVITGDIDAMWLRDSSAPVSYTHLDVYKRQA